MQLVVSDDHAGLKQALPARLPSVPWQRCQFHLAQNALHYVPRLEERQEVAADLRGVFDSSERRDAEERLQKMIQKYEKRMPKLAAWLETNAAEGLTVLDFPAEHRRRLRTTNGLERLNKEIKRRTRGLILLRVVALPKLRGGLVGR